ncbi:nicotinamide riboside transporter PnuC [Chryseobacterium indoltheticum]|uniref:nicotinamide riboside transporter PnuC n=1 Tax=Chryseobacterium indoltheticum TaxID=254 RepID=UPI003F498A77
MQDILQQTTWQEWLGVFFSVFQVLLARKNNSNNYLFGIAGISLTLYVMIQSKLSRRVYAQSLLLGNEHLRLAVLKFGKRKSETVISETTNLEKIITAGIVVGTFSLFWVFLTNFTDSDVPILDSLVSAFAWAGMWLMARRKIENWILLNISNIIAIPLLIHKGLYLYAVLTAFLFIVAISGYLEWRKSIKSKSVVV